MENLAAFAAITVLLAIISRRSLTRKRSHGYYRFLAWECIAAVAVLNIPRWFSDPWSWHQILSWLLLIFSLVPLGFGIPTLIRQGGERRKDQGGDLLGFEKTSRLVTSGIYRYIRHPMYSSLLLLAWGIYFKAPLSVGLLLVSGATFFLLATAKADEAECLDYFGSTYTEYMRKTRRFIPGLF